MIEEEDGASVAMERVNVLLAGVDWMDFVSYFVKKEMVRV